MRKLHIQLGFLSFPEVFNGKNLKYRVRKVTQILPRACVVSCDLPVSRLITELNHSHSTPNLHPPTVFRTPKSGSTPNDPPRVRAAKLPVS